jgi:methionine-rich copper-binding protein CopC
MSEDRFVIYFSTSKKSTIPSSASNTIQPNHVEMEHTTSWTIYPNPVVGSKINLVCNDHINKEGIKQIKVFDLKGVVLCRLNLNMSTSQRNYVIHLPKKLKSGNYMLEINNNESTQRMKFILAE